MSRLSQILLIAIAVLVIASTSAFTPDAAFKMKTMLGNGQTTASDANGKRGLVVPPQPLSSRNLQLSLIGQENIRKSITVPPAYEDYMAVRQHALLRLLQRND
ncbi:expressed unknown protein [Seminavis robusta]|uniref:Uncharacterized protein n=1 Tax=Seminavis robusta TaxID=568900 RepID=A0A9N8E5I1_9STRA|nr:expressed unknown protein [Seminavis robusta]|eukprot:Sro682_g186550.1 n/a (103) ;mRNA; f:44800-45269